MKRVNLSLTDDQVLALMQSGDPINLARKQFSNACGFMDQDARQRRPMRPIEMRRAEFEYAQTIIDAHATGVANEQSAAVAEATIEEGTLKLLSTTVVRQAEGLIALQFEVSDANLEAQSMRELVHPYPSVRVFHVGDWGLTLSFPRLEGWTVWSLTPDGTCVHVTLMKK